jgi:hypothetical protein
LHSIPPETPCWLVYVLQDSTSGQQTRILCLKWTCMIEHFSKQKPKANFMISLQRVCYSTCMHWLTNSARVESGSCNLCTYSSGV